MKVRKLVLPVVAAALSLSLASCDLTGEGTKDPGTSVDGTSVPAGESTPAPQKKLNYTCPDELDKTKDLTISFYHTMGDSLQKVLQTAIDKFENDYPNFHVDAQQIGGYNDVYNTIQTQIANDEQPNLAYCYSDHVASYNRARAVAHLDSLIDNDKYGLTAEQKADFIQGYYNEGKSFGDDCMYTVPFSKSTEVIYYNKTEFEKQGWDINKAQTWEGLMELAREIKEDYPNCYPVGIDSSANVFIEICEQIGSPYTSAKKGENYLFNNDTNKAFVNQFKTWFNEGLYTTQDILGTYTSSLFVSTDDAPGKRSFISIGSTGGASHQYPTGGDFDVAVAPIPKYGTNAELKCISQGPSLCIFNKDDAQEVLATWIFVKDYLLDPEFQVTFAQASGYNPVRNSCYDVEVEDPADPTGETMITYRASLEGAQGTSANGLIALTAKTCMNLTGNYFTSPAFNGSAKARIQVGDLFTAVISGAKTVDKAFADAILECED